MAAKKKQSKKKSTAKPSKKKAGKKTAKKVTSKASKATKTSTNARTASSPSGSRATSSKKAIAKPRKKQAHRLKATVANINDEKTAAKPAVALPIPPQSQELAIHTDEAAAIDDNSATPGKSLHLWEFIWLRDLFMLAMFCLILWFGYSERAITLPLLFGLLFAYLFNPIVTRMEVKYHVSRGVSATAILLIGVCVIAAFVRIVVPPLIEQTTDLFNNRESILAGVEAIGDWAKEVGLIQGVGTDTTTDATNAAPSVAEGSIHIRDVIQKVLGLGYGVVSGLFDWIVFVGLFITIVSFCFFFFTCDFNATVRWFIQFIPAKHLPETAHIVKRMDKAVSGFVRGRLIQCLTMGIMLSIGFSIPGWLSNDLFIPYALLLGILGGALTIIPYAFWLSCIGAIVLSWVSRLSGDVEITPALGIGISLIPILVLGIANTIDAFLIEPFVQGKATNLSPLAILIAVLIGGSVAGLLGLIIAIPLTSCMRILGEEVIVPHLKRYVQELP